MLSGSTPVFRPDGSNISTRNMASSLCLTILLEKVQAWVREYQNTPGLLLYLLGNENNYGLFREGAETEDIPEGDLRAATWARAMYQLFNEGVFAIEQIDINHPVAICNGDLLYLDLIAEECPDADILGPMHTGVFLWWFFWWVKTEYGKPVLFTEFGRDAYNVISQAEDQDAQAYFNPGN